MAIELVKENIEYEQLLGENTVDNVIKEEYVIPDTHPDVEEIFILDAKPNIVSAEVMQDKVYIEGQIAYNVLYLGKDEKSAAFSVSYTGKFSNYIDVSGAAHKMLCEPEVTVEHMEAVIVNERKIAIEGIIKLKARVTQNAEFEIVKDIQGPDDVQLLKSPNSIDRVIGLAEGNLMGTSHIVVPVDKPQIGSILKIEVNVHKKALNVIEGKVQAEALALIQILYKAKDGRDVYCLSDDVAMNSEIELANANPSMNCFGSIRFDNVEYNIKDDDLGESRLLDMELACKAEAKVISKENIDAIEDAYSPNVLMNMSKNEYQLNIINGFSSYETIVKEDIGVGLEGGKPLSVVMVTGKASITDKKLVEDKAVIEGILNVDVLYTTSDEDKYLGTINEELPFTCYAEIPGTKIDMQCNANIYIESLEAQVEGLNIAVKGVVSGFAKVSYNTNKDFLINVEEAEEGVPEKKSSITIYVVQPGDTLWKIAKKYSTTLETLVKINNLEDPDNVTLGEKLIIPGRALI